MYGNTGLLIWIEKLLRYMKRKDGRFRHAIRSLNGFRQGFAKTYILILQNFQKAKMPLPKHDSIALRVKIGKQP